MSGCTIFFHAVSHLAHKTVLGAATMCGNGTAAMTDSTQPILLPNIAPTIYTSADDMDKYGEAPLSAVDPDTPDLADAEFVPSPHDSANRPAALRPPSRSVVAGSSEMVPEQREPGSAITEDSEDSESVRKGRGIIPEALRARGGLTVSGGYSSVEGPNAEVKIARRNIGGLNREITASARYSKVQTLFEIGYADGDFLGGGIVFAPTLFANRLSATGFGNGLRSTPFGQSARGINLHLNRKFDSGLSLTANYRLSADTFRMRGKSATCNVGIFGSPFCGALGKTTSSVLSLAVALDRRDSATDPTRGFKLRLTQDLAGLGGSARYTRTRFGGEAYIGIGGDWNLSIGAEAGLLAPFAKGKIPLFDRFYIGGTSMRGFDLRGIGPKIVPSAASPGQNVAIGGRAYYAVRAELSVPVGGFLGKHGLQPCAFIDAGSAFGARKTGLLPGETLIGNSARPRVAIGVGLALNTPAGKLRLDFARPIVKQSGDRGRMLSISFGTAI
jgi:outer membrane protein assembly factor BamA